jgi:four helix bundle protein
VEVGRGGAGIGYAGSPNGTVPDQLSRSFSSWLPHMKSSIERYGLTSQTRRAAFSAAVNIVEGSSRKGRKEFRRFLDISLSSQTEVGYALLFAREAGLLEESVWRELSDKQNRARFLTWRLYRALAGGSPPPTSTNPRPSSTLT